ncbi:MAG: hypothetical protein LUG99_15795 [Lachnospiraceae bacterium]|nr:hypothetical protein [Lachnospiraceae bacterium]
MNKNILKALYSGEIYPAEKVVSREEGYQTSLRELDSLVTELEERMNEEDYKLVDSALDICAEQTDYQCFEFFRYGFSLAMQICCETKEIMKLYHFPDDSLDADTEKETGSKIIDFSIIRK